MRLLSSVFSFYVNGSIHVAFAVLALVGTSVLEYDLEIPFALWVFIFFGTITGYNFVKYAKIAGVRHRELTNSLKSIQIFSFICFGITVYFAFRLSFDTVLLISGFALLTFFYAVPFLKSKNLRSLTSMKIFVVALVWAGVTVIVPVLSIGVELNVDILLTFVQRFFIVVVLIIPFEIRDLKFDVASLRTLPQQLGVKRVKAVGIFLLLICLVFEGFKDKVSEGNFIGLLMLCILIASALISSNKQQLKYFASFWIEGIPIVWLAILFLLSNLF
ncbi:MAG: hypothetical protein ACI83B_000740 [Sediminicola sp.]|jgi:hypothetical protein|tara:strand:+ start:1683 stop:2504 length:822 start_codon:yes stop_codon:yes gene_type:complete